MKPLLCRPPKDAREVERFDGRRWRLDDGKPGVAFSWRTLRGFPCAGWVRGLSRDADFEVTHLGDPLGRTAARWKGANFVSLPPLHLRLIEGGAGVGAGVGSGVGARPWHRDEPKILEEL
jgi:hypothetical protein